jgi:hypothetical protein
MLPNYEIQIVPSGMTIYNPPMSDDAFNPSVGLAANLTDFEKEATDICLGAGELSKNKTKYVNLAKERATKLNDVSGWNFWINGLDGAKKTAECKWGAKRGRVAEVIRVLKRERDKWVKAKEGIGTPVVSQVGGRTNLTAPTWNPVNANWEAIAKDLGDKLTTKEELVSIIKSKMQIEKNKDNNNAGIIAAQNIYDASINGLEANKKAVAWGVKRTRVNAAIRLIKNTIRRPETLVDIVGGEVQPIPNKSAEDIAKEQQQTALEKVIDWFGLSPDDEAGDVTGGETNGSGEGDKPNYTPLLAGGGVVVAIILVGVLISAANKGVKPKS